MIAHLTGYLVATELDWIIIDVQGVGYEVHIPVGMPGQLKEDADGRVSVWIHTNVREDAIQLYGFARREDRQLFRRLTNVNGIGPRTALATLSELKPIEVVRAVHNEDIKTFTRVSGIGKKTAQRLILELKNKLDDLMIDATPITLSPALEQHGDLRSALLNLGFPSSNIDGVLDEILDDAEDDEPMEVLLRQALRMLN